MTANTDRLVAAIDAMIRARNEANDAQQRYADTTASVGAESLGKAGQVARQHAADNLYDATYELIHRIDNLIGSVDWQNLMLGLDK